MIANYYLMITELSKIQLTQDDYGDKKKVKLSNRASKTLQGIEKEMRKDLSRDKTRGECIDILDRLLDHEDDRVKINARKFLPAGRRSYGKSVGGAEKRCRSVRG